MIEREVSLSTSYLIIYIDLCLCMCMCVNMSMEARKKLPSPNFPRSFPIFLATKTFIFFPPSPTTHMPFVLAKYFWVWGLSWSVGHIPGVIALKKTDFPSPNSYQTLIVLQRELGFHTKVPKTMLGFCLIWCISLILSVTINVSSYVYLHCCLEGIHCLWRWVFLLTSFMYISKS